MFYVKANNLVERDMLLAFLKSKGIYAVFHYLPLHQSDFVKKMGWSQKTSLENSIKFSDTLIRLPFYIGLSNDEINFITDNILSFYKKINLS
jgi:dTDP-4-amino-4,6-dideoxygalactose transaminase